MTRNGSTLILAWGNPARLDDGLGPALARTISELALPGVAVDSDYQLQVEDAETASRHARVIFVDADRRGGAPFTARRLSPERRGISFSTHSVTPGAVLALARDLFSAEPEAWLLGIRGYEFDEFGEGLSDGASANLAEATRYVRDALASGGFREVIPDTAALSTIQDDEGEPCPTTSH